MYQSSSARDAKDYYTAALAQEDYYVQGRGVDARWRGLGAERLGLTGTVSREAFAALCENQHPMTGERLTPRTRDDRTVGYDFNFHLPKGVSVYQAITGDDRIVEVFREAVDETMAELESEMLTRVRLAGRMEERVTGNLVWGEFVHRTARPVDGVPDPHLHIHCYVFNATFDEHEARWKAGQFRELKRDAPYFEAAFHARMAGKLADLGYPVERVSRTGERGRPSRGGAGWDLAGIEASTKERFSQRTTEIEAAAARLGIEDAAGRAGLGAKTRKAKSKSLSPQQLMALWDERLSEAEREQLFAIAMAADLARERSTAQAGAGTSNTPAQVPDPAREPAQDAVQYAIDHAFERASVVSDKQLLGEALRHGVGRASPAEVVAAFDARRDLIHARDGRDRLVTTRAVLEEEAAVLKFARDGKGTVAPLGAGYGGREGERYAIGAVSVRDGVQLNHQQTAAVEHLLASTDRVTLLRGGAGVGKTTLMREAAAAIDHGGKKVVAVAPTAEAGRGVLRDVGFERSETLAMLLADETLQASARGQVIWVDEAGLVGTPTMKKLCELSSKLDARLILSGDTRQHAPVERGDAMRLLETRAGIKPAEVKEVVRQRGVYKQAVEAISERRVLDGLQHLDALGSIRELDEDSRHATLAGEFLDTVKRGKSALVVSPTHREGEAVTELIREELKAAGRLGDESRSVTRLRDLQLTEAEKSDPHHYAAGQVIHIRQNIPADRKQDTPAYARGQKLTVAGHDREHNRLDVHDEKGRSLPFGLTHTGRFGVYEKDTAEVAVGDTVRMTANGTSKDGVHRLNNGTLYRVNGFTPEGDMVLANKGRWIVDKDYGHVTHGYCITPQASQGKSVDVCLAALGSRSLGHSTFEQLYVVMTRGKEAVRVFTDDRRAMARALVRDAERMSATEAAEKAQANADATALTPPNSPTVVRHPSHMDERMRMHEQLRAYERIQFMNRKAREKLERARQAERLRDAPAQRPSTPTGKTLKNLKLPPSRGPNEQDPPPPGKPGPSPRRPDRGGPDRERP